MSATPESTPPPPFPQTREFWVLMAYAVGLGVLGAFASLVFMGVIGFGNNWYDVSDPSWFGGQWWWVAVTAAAGVVVGVVRRLTHLPEKTPGLIADLVDEHVDARLVPGITAVSAVSLIGAPAWARRRRSARSAAGPAAGSPGEEGSTKRTPR
jgi:hypothetical protein